MQWTSEQRSAIETDGCDILVAAGAGSGKTAVLVERILRRVLGDGDNSCNIDRLLIVTFTKAAAAEMRSRIYEGLRKRMLEDTADTDTLRRLYAQQMLLSRAQITTIHGFCNSVIVGNVRESGIDGSFRIADEASASAMLSEAAEDAAEELALSEPSVYARLMDIYGNYRSDDGLIELIKSLYEFSSSFLNQKKWLTDCVDSFRSLYSGNADFAKSAWGDALLSGVALQTRAQIGVIERLLNKADEHGIDVYKEALEDDLAVINDLAKFVGNIGNDGNNVTWEAAYSKYADVSFTKLRPFTAMMKEALGEEATNAAAEISKRRREVIDDIRKIVKRLFLGDAEAPYKDAMSMIGDMEAITRLVLRLDELYTERKREAGFIDYADLEHIAFDVLYKNPDVAQRYRQLFEEVYIDEYQDTNEIQDAILSLVSRDGTDDGMTCSDYTNRSQTSRNRFMVGDVKQSIYAFRQARPDIFLDKYKRYAESESEQEARVLLYHNFRSRRQVIDTVNSVFSDIMNERTCNMSYDIEEYLNYAASYDDNENDDAYRTEIVVIDGTEFNDPSLAEMHEVTRRIQSMINDRFLITDNSLGGKRPVMYSDICILMRSTASRAKKYAEYMMSYGIPTYSAESGNFFGRPEIQVAFSFLKVIDNPLQDIPLISVLRNVYGISDEALAAVRLCCDEREVYFYDSCRRSSDETVLSVIRRIEEIRNEARTSRISAVVWTLLHENGFYDSFADMPDGHVARQNLMMLLSRAGAYDTSVNRGLVHFIHQLDVAARKNENVPSASGVAQGMNAVRIMTIHKSKGLEFPVVFICETGKKRNILDETSRFTVHRRLGYGPTCYNEERKIVYPSIMKEAVRMQIAFDMKAEEMRVLYVAMTRAREKLIITGTVKAPFDDFISSCEERCDIMSGKPLDYHIISAETYIDLLGMALAGGSDRDLYSSSYIVTKPMYTDELKDKAEDDGEQLLPPDKARAPQVMFGLPQHVTTDFERFINKKDLPSSSLPVKVSVSELTRLRREWLDPEAVPVNVPTVQMESMSNIAPLENEVSGAHIGTLLHEVLQHIDYSRVTELNDADAADAYTEELLLYMRDCGFISDEEGDMIPRDIIRGFLLSDMARRIAAADYVMRETPFTLNVPWKVLIPECDDEREAAVQGVIDCIFAEGESIILLDFKSDFVSERTVNEHSRRYETQLRIYATACEQAFKRRPSEVSLYYLRLNKSERIDVNNV